MRFAEHPASSPYQQGLDKNLANYAPLTPLSFLERTADVFPTRTAVIHGPWRADHTALRTRSRRLASALGRLRRRSAPAVEVLALYWYFVALSSVAVWATLYLSPHLM